MSGILCYCVSFSFMRTDGKIEMLAYEVIPDADFYNGIGKIVDK